MAAATAATPFPLTRCAGSDTSGIDWKFVSSRSRCSSVRAGDCCTIDCTLCSVSSARSIASYCRLASPRAWCQLALISRVALFCCIAASCCSFSQRRAFSFGISLQACTTWLIRSFSGMESFSFHSLSALMTSSRLIVKMLAFCCCCCLLLLQSVLSWQMSSLSLSISCRWLTSSALLLVSSLPRATSCCDASAKSSFSLTFNSSYSLARSWISSLVSASLFLCTTSSWMQ
uniref:(northern house mosquito) hypothetical protein n=1 Tax=Culex pipiens TaxID=7175 RepID=A0A8D8C8X0_CULPI